MYETLPKEKNYGVTRDTNAPKIPVLDTYNIIGHIFLMTPQEYGQKFWVHIVNITYYHETKSSQEPGHTQFICYVNDDQYENIMSYNYIINNISNQEDEDMCENLIASFPMR